MIPRTKEDLLNLPKIKYENKKYLPEFSGIYFVFAYNKLMYIGKAENIKNRFMGHHKGKDFSNFDNCYIHYLRCDLINLSVFERGYINIFRPPMNDNIYRFIILEKENIYNIGLFELIINWFKNRKNNK